MGVNTLNGSGKKLRVQGRYLALGLGEGRFGKMAVEILQLCVCVLFLPGSFVVANIHYVCRERAKDFLSVLMHNVTNCNPTK